MSKIIKNTTTQKLDGNVTIKVKQGKTTLKKVTIHNTATLNLLYGLMLSLSGNIDTDCLPRFLGVGTGIGDTQVNMTGLEAEVTKLRTPVTPNYKGAPVKTADSATVKVQGILPYDNLGIVNNISEIGLFGTQKGDSLVARIQLYDSSKLPSEQTDLISVGIGQSLVVEWQFSITNVN